MADNKQNIGEPDRSRVSGSEPYELDYFAQKHDLTREQARELVEKHGNDRETLDRAAERLKGGHSDRGPVRPGTFLGLSNPRRRLAMSLVAELAHL